MRGNMAALDQLSGHEGPIIVWVIQHRRMAGFVYASRWIEQHCCLQLSSLGTESPVAR
jgi:hypothetical protein